MMRRYKMFRKKLTIPGAYVIAAIIVGIMFLATYVLTVDSAHFEAPEPGTFRLTNGHGTPLVSETGGLTGGHDEIEFNVDLLSRQEQIKMMKECIEDAIAVCQDANIYPLTYWSKGEVKGDDTIILAAEIAVAFFNYRTGER